jgi:hypothetical protein
MGRLYTLGNLSDASVAPSAAIILLAQVGSLQNEIRRFLWHLKQVKSLGITKFSVR